MSMPDEPLCSDLSEERSEKRSEERGGSGSLRRQGGADRSDAPVRRRSGRSSAFLTHPVDRPVEKGKFALQKTRSGTYVHAVLGRERNPETGRMVSRRTLIGKCCPDDPGKMYPNRKYFELFPDATQPDAAQANTDSVGQESDLPQTPDPAYSAALAIGVHVAVHKLAQVSQDDGLAALLDEHCGDLAGLVLDLACYRLLREEAPGLGLADYAWQHPLFMPGRPVQDDELVLRALKALGESGEAGFLDDWNACQGRQARVCIPLPADRTGPFPDRLRLVERGSGTGSAFAVPGTTALCLDARNRTPLFCAPLALADVESQLLSLADVAGQYGRGQLCFLLDGGTLDRHAVRTMDENGWSFVLVLASTLVQGREHVALADELRGLLGPHDPDKVCGWTVRRPLSFVGSTEDGGRVAVLEERDRFVHLIFDPARRLQDRAELEEQLAWLKLALKSLLAKPVSDFPAWCAEWFELVCDDQGLVREVREKRAALDKERERCGYVCLVTSEAMSAEEAWRLYTAHDPADSLFVRELTDESEDVEGLVPASALAGGRRLVTFVALLLRTCFRALLQKAAARDIRWAGQPVSVDRAFALLDHILFFPNGPLAGKLDPGPRDPLLQLALQALGLDWAQLARQGRSLAAQVAAARRQPCLLEDAFADRDEQDDF